jgi:hybrid cluster-associated redox disulfide protein
MSIITADALVDDVVSQFPATARVFVARRMLCVGCALAPFETLAEASRAYGQSVEPLLSDLRVAATDAEGST